MSAVIGIDIGSSSIKGILLADGVVLLTERLPIPPRIETNIEHFEHDPIAIRDATFDIIRGLTRRASELAFTVRAIAFTGQMHGGLIVDNNLQPLTNFVTWQDKRATVLLPHLETLFSDDQTGVGIHNGFFLATIVWWRQQGLFPVGASYFLGIYDWLTSLLAGRAVTDITSAAAWAMCDPVHREWRSGVLNGLEVSHKLLPEVLEPGAIIGKIQPALADELGFSHQAQIHASIGDTQAAYLGSGCTTTDLLLNFGTGSQSIWETDHPVSSSGTDIRYLRDGRFIVTAPTLAGGEAYRVMAEFIEDVLRIFGSSSNGGSVQSNRSVLYDQMNDLALGASSEGIRFNPIFAGSKFRPETERATISGLSSSNFRIAPVLRALVEGMIEEIAAPYFAREGRMRHIRLIGSGSGIRTNRALQEAAERRFGVQLVLAPFGEEAALGAAKLCG